MHVDRLQTKGVVAVDCEIEGEEVAVGILIIRSGYEGDRATFIDPETYESYSLSIPTNSGTYFNQTLTYADSED